MTTPTVSAVDTTFSSADLAARTIQRRSVDAVIWGATLALIHSRRPDILERLTAAPELLL